MMLKFNQNAEFTFDIIYKFLIFTLLQYRIYNIHSLSKAMK